MRREEVENYMLYPRSWEQRDYSRECDRCNNGISYYEKYYRLPKDISPRYRVVCEKCLRKETTDADYDGFCLLCEKLIAEDEKVYLTPENHFVCMGCIEGFAEEDSK